MPRKSLALIGPRTIQRYDEERIDEDMARIGTIKEANKITGGLSEPSKIPGHAYKYPFTSARLAPAFRTCRVRSASGATR